jgi:hypothetical protein
MSKPPGVSESRAWSFLSRPRPPFGGPRRRLRRFQLRHPLRGALLAGLSWEAFMFLFLCCVSLFQDVLLVLEVTAAGTIVITIVVFLATLRARWKGEDTLDESQSIG